MRENMRRGIPDDLWRNAEDMTALVSQVNGTHGRSRVELVRSLLLKLPELEALRQTWPGVARDENLFNKALSVATAAYQQGVADGLALSRHAAELLESLERVEAQEAAAGSEVL